GRMEVRSVSLRVETIVDECLRTLEPTVSSERVRLVKHLPADLPPLVTDADKLKQILINLLSNAIKFTEVGSVTISAEHTSGEVITLGTDRGMGIPPDPLELIFEELQEVDSTTTRKWGGKGLGLSTPRHFARLLGGDVTVTSALGRGSTFT